MNEPVRIAHVIGKLNAAGVEAVVNNYYKNIDHDKYQFDFFIDADSSCDPKPELMEMGAHYYTIPPYQHIFSHIKELKKIFKENKYKVVHSGMNTLAPISLYAAKCAGVPVRINHNHSTAAKGETKKNILKYMLRPFARCFATSYAACSYYAGEWLFGSEMMKSGKVTVFNNAIDLDRYRKDDDVRMQMRNELGINDELVIGHVGRFCYQKNHDFLIDIFNEIHKKNDKTVLILVGIGELEKDVEEKVRQLGLQQSVKFLGVRNDVNLLYQAMDAFVLPSRYEGLPVVGVEAQASGVPCVFSDAITKDVVMTDSAKMLSLSDGAAVWADCVLSSIAHGRKDTSADIRKAGFDIKEEAKKLEGFYKTEMERLGAK